MEGHRTVRPTAHAPALVALAALQLVLTTSAVGVTQESANHVTDRAPRPAPAEAPHTAVVADLPSTEPTEAAATALGPVERPTLGGERRGRLDEIPWQALQAYQRAAEILGEVQSGCGMSWELLAAVGHVESDHGRALGGEVGSDGVVRPALVGRSLDGTGTRPALEDSDEGEIDGDPRWDRAVGPMQLLPGTWQVVAVDGDGDGDRSEQDIDDAALAAGVYLCASGADVGTREGATAALLSLNAATEYVDEVLAAEATYQNGDFRVAGRPNPQSIGLTLDHGSGTPAQRDDSGRADHDAEEQRRSPGSGTEQTRTRPVAEPEESAAEGAARPEPTVSDDQDEPSEAPRPEPTVSDDPAEPSGESEPTADEAEAAEDDAVEDDAVEDDSSNDAETDPESETDPDGLLDDGTATEQADGDAGDEDSEPSEAEPAGEQPAGEEPADEELVTATLAGTLTACGEAGAEYCLDGLALDLTVLEDPLTAAPADLDGDGAGETVAEELAGLEGEAVELVVRQGDPLFVVAVNGIAQVP